MEENTAYSDLVLNVRYIYHDMWKGRNEIVDRMPLMTGGPWSILLITAGYIWFATVSGPNYMKNRDAFDLRPILLVYNVIMMLINGYIFYKAAFFTNFGIYPWRCSAWGQEPDKVNEEQIREMLEISWLFFFSKFLDFIDTIFFVLRKKGQQLSRLHLIHHSLMPICVFLGLKFQANMSAGFVPFINSFVHTAMYLYYALSSLKFRVWWKKYLTQLQMGQLMLVVLHSLYLSIFSPCELYPSFLAYPIGFLSLMLFCLFANFFYQSYVKNERLKNDRLKNDRLKTSKSLNEPENRTTSNTITSKSLSNISKNQSKKES